MDHFSSTVVETEYTKTGREMSWDNSPRDSNGRLLKRSNEHVFREYRARIAKARSPYLHIPSGTWGAIETKTGGFFDPQLYGDSNYTRDMSNEVHFKFYEELNEVKLGLGQIFAERRKTIEMIASSALALANLYGDLRRGVNPFRGRRKVNPKNAHNLWLEYSYGWVPLVSDVYDVLEFQKKNAPTARIRKKIRGGESTHYETSQPDLRSNIRTTHQYRMRHVAVAGAKVRIEDPGWAFLNQFDISNPLSLAWELLPYSFVVDWFIPVGDFLRIQNSLAGITLVNPYSVSKTLAKYDCTVRIVPDGLLPDIYQVDYSEASAYSEYVWKHRQPYIPMPSLTTMVKLDISKAISALALLTQRFKH